VPTTVLIRERSLGWISSDIALEDFGRIYKEISNEVFAQDTMQAL